MRDAAASSLGWLQRLGQRRGRVPLVLQSEAAECGLACLAMVAGAHGLDTDLQTLRQRFQLSLKGATAADVSEMGSALGLAPRALRCELADLDKLHLPCVLHWNLNHFVVLVAVRRGVLTLHDPARGVRHMSVAAASPHFTGVVLEFTPTASFQPRRDRQPVRLRQLLGPVHGLKRALGQVLFLALALEFFVMLSPLLLQQVVDGVLVTGQSEFMLTLGIGFGGLVLFQVLAAGARSWALMYLSSSLKLQWLGQVFSHLLTLPLAWFERRQTGDVWSRFAAVHEIQDKLTTQFAEGLIDGVMVLFCLGLMWLISPLLSAVALAAVLLYALVRWALAGPMREATEEALVHDAKKSTHFLESLRGVSAIKLFNAQAQRQSRFMNLVVDAMNADLTLRRLELRLALAHRGLFGLERVAVVWLGALAVLDGGLSTGLLFAFLAYQEQFATRTSALIDKLGELRLLKVQADRLADIVLTAPEHDGSVLARPPKAADCEGRLELRDVHFAYSDLEPEVLRGVSLCIEPGDSVAIVGPSGCGKTTLLKLLLGVHVPTAGEVCMDGRPLAHWGLRPWREALGAVLQEEPLFAGSIADNIAFFTPETDMDWVRTCARMASVLDDIEAMPMGFHTLVGDMGAALSGGQKQRILLARALYRRPRVLLLDEATSALDVDRERLVNRAVQQLQLTRIIVAHRPDTVASADRVIVLSEGRVVQDFRRVPGVGAEAGAEPGAVSGAAA
ncbi:peptidase domain-containing ABC transporter [Ideonella margarita]|uniref:Peptidase domain-containing ABC transporter n=1 Tax=Ideonella margarita TaxID=2984191 RepID=A0ABU9C572_9BURK